METSDDPAVGDEANLSSVANDLLSLMGEAQFVVPAGGQLPPVEFTVPPEDLLPTGSQTESAGDDLLF